MQTIQVDLKERAYEIKIVSHQWHQLAAALAKVLAPGKVLLVSDEHVWAHYGSYVESALQGSYTVVPVIIPPGEASKTLAEADRLYTVAIEAGLDRSNAVIALGGGVVGDLAGFVAATYLRGVPFVQIPTTLLAQVDSSVGGKVAVNHRLGKNLIGAFYQPKLVWIELETLKTLPPREFMAGAAEVVKYGAILSADFITFLEENWAGFLKQDKAILQEIIATCCRLKSQVVVEDERETGKRAILNFGHTLGHALEAATSFQYYLHGEAVLAGMVMAVDIAQKLLLLSHVEAKRLLRLFARVGVKPAPPDLSQEAVLAALKQDKKRRGEETVFILPTSVGEVVSYRHVSREIISEVLAKYLQGIEGSLLTLAD
ncbi:MAG: 3-dehydroquinate synthase [Firmicutes bacterium]|nr:3-dehydroquinate synthase [Bacillota bacterium]